MLESFGLTDPGCVRQNNEDCYFISPDDGVYIVADGMGGAQAGEHASKMAVETVASIIRSSPARDVQTLVHAFQEANLRVMKAAASDPELEGMGTTMVAALESGPELLIASVGDSRAYVYEQSALTSVTEDQTWVNEVGRKLGIDEASLKTHPMRHVLTMAIGVSPEVRVQSRAVQPHPGELILLSSDGLHGVLEGGVIADKLSGNGSLQAKCERLIDAAKQAGGPDNITVVLLKPK